MLSLIGENGRSMTQAVEAPRRAWPRLPRAAPAPVRAVAALLPVAVATLAGVAVSADTTVAALLLLLAVVVSSAVGVRIGLVASVAGFLALAALFTPPSFAAAVRTTDDLVALATYLLVAVSTGWLVGRATALRRRAELHEREARLRLDLKDRLIAGETPQAVAAHATTMLVSSLGLAACTFHAGDVSASASADRPPGRPLRLEPGGARVELVPARDRPVDRDQIALAEAVAEGLAAAIDRNRLAQEADGARLAATVAKSRSDLLSAVTHDLRTPLAAITASAATLSLPDAPLDAGERRELLDTIGDEADRLERLVAKVLALSRIRAGGLRPARKPVDLEGLLGSVAHRLRWLQGDRDLVLDVPDDLPPLEVDVVLMQQVFANLLENALRYAPRRSPVVVAAGSVPGGEAVEVRVADRGPGVPPEHRQRVFEEFHRVAPDREAFGTGLGLAIVWALVAAHGGSVRYEESPGGGATFVVRLPRAAS